MEKMHLHADHPMVETESKQCILSLDDLAMSISADLWEQKSVLRPDFEALSWAVQETKEEIAEYVDLRERLEKFQNDKDCVPVEANRVDLGYQKVFCRATINCTELLFVHIGMGFQVKLTMPEAQRLQFLSREV